MDIPNSGAIFTLGKSHLAENTQSYFYIKNDPVKRLISGPNQSAVICESGRLFVWGENHYGQLGIGGNNNNNNNNNSNGSNGDTITKPTCVKSLKTLGLKIADIAFGNDWAVILTHSNELFFTGRNIFASETSVARNFTDATVANEQCTIIRKPFRLEEFDDCLSKSEETENFVTVLAGNEHFAAMTSFGRLIGWGCNQSHQLGTSSKEASLLPHEITIDAPVQQFTCGPESTLVLTENGNLYLTGRLNEFVFPQFTELQKNLAPTEQIIFMHISKASEIYIVTNAGSIYRSIESVRNKSLIFQRFYDYDSEENGPIWKLLKGSSFYTVLTKANKFYTTFSESGHHLKTFREISKFKNLRLLDMAVGDQHILAHGIPRSSTLSATVGPGGEHRFMSRTYVMTAPEINGNGSGRGRIERNLANEKIVEEVDAEPDANGNTEGSGALERKETPKPNTPIHASIAELNDEITNINDDFGEEKATSATEVLEVNGNDNGEGIQLADQAEEETGQEELENTLEGGVGKVAAAFENGTHLEDSKPTAPLEDAETPPSRESPTQSIRSQRSVRSAALEKAALKKSSSKDKLLRPRTPYPDSSSGNSPQTLKKTPLRNFSYEAAMDHDFIDHTSPALVDSLENIPESAAAEEVSAPITTLVSMPTPPVEEDEQLTVEINTTTDALDSTIVINEIRFINNGIDVTANVKQKALETDDESIDDSLDEHVADARNGAEVMINQMEQEIEENVEKVVDMKNEVQQQAGAATEKMGDKVESKMQMARESVETAAKKAATGARDAADAVGENAKRMANDARHAVETAGGNAMKAAGDARHAVESVGGNAMKVAGDARHAMESAGGNAMKAAGDARHVVETAGGNAMKVAGDAKKAMGNAFNKVTDDTKQAFSKAADGTKHAVGAVTTKISNEMQGAKDNLSSMFQGGGKGERGEVSKETEENDGDSSEATSKEGGPKTTTTIGEDDERTTASVNSNQTSAGNPFERGNPFEANNPFENDLDDAMERGKQTLRNELRAGERVEEGAEQSKGKVRQFFSDMRAKGKGMSCRNEKAIRIDDEPPRYTVEDELSLQTTHGNQNSSKVCTIL